MYFDFHIHSGYSFDALMKPEKIIRIAKKKKLDGVAITDHNTIKGSIEAAKMTKNQDFIVISGTEIATDYGDIIGLYIDEEIRARRCLEVIDEIHTQGGLVVLPHPYKGHILNDEVLSRIDLIEVFNGRCSSK
ncbi:MAG: PHP domain-containing protein, partial [Thermoplasmata archaeon]